MRKDLGKCVIERPRRGSGSARSAKARDYGVIVCDDEGYEYVGLSRLPVGRKQEGYNKKLGDKDVTDVLGPIEGYLASSVGRLWDDVFSDICRTLGRAPWPIRHIIHDHLDVARNTYRGADGHVYAHDRHGLSRVGEGLWQRDFYVEPETGILRKTAKRVSYHASRRKKEPDADELSRVPADRDGWFYVRIGGLWFLGEYVGKPARFVKETVTYSGRRFTTYADAEWPDQPAREGFILAFQKKKSCSKREIRDLLKKRAAILAKRFPDWAA